jgi:hypothetical protein
MLVGSLLIKLDDQCRSSQIVHLLSNNGSLATDKWGKSMIKCTE